MSRVPKSRTAAMNDVIRSAEHYANTMMRRRKEYGLTHEEKPFTASMKNNSIFLRLRPGYERLNQIESTLPVSMIRRKAVRQAIKNRRNLTGLVNSIMREGFNAR